MEYRFVDFAKADSDDSCLVIGVLSDNLIPVQIEKQEKQLATTLSNLIRRLETEGDRAWCTDPCGRDIFVIHCGDKANYSLEKQKKRIADITNFLTQQRYKSACVALPTMSETDADTQSYQMILNFDNLLFQLLDFKTKDKKPHALASIQFLCHSPNEKLLSKATSAAQGVRLTRYLANLPANVCTPTYLAKQAKTLEKQHSSITTTVLDEHEIEKLQMGSFLSVARGSHEKPRFIEIQYRGVDNDPSPVVLVGKGVTFDSGGISLKPPQGMEEMKFDMAGAASVLGTIKACALQKLPIHVIGLIPTTENMPGGKATKPGDVVTSMSGKTIEITNTDAEGRLILADALTYANRFNPRFVIDIATLTGAVIIALGHEASAVLTKDEALAALILQAAEKSGDPTWRLPLHEAYQEALASPIADMVNSTPDRAAGTITGACFLSRFTENYPWAHLDIAGTAWVSGKNRNATGRPVPLLLEILNHVAQSR